MSAVQANVQTNTAPRNSRRLAVIDTRFPWKLSGFRYWENRQIYWQRPDTLFFATEPYPDPFPAVVYPFSQFKEIAASERVTDLYCVFLNLTLSLIGSCYLPDGSFMPGSNPGYNIKQFVEERNIKLHSTLYPGGGLDPMTKEEFIRTAARHCTTVFTNIEEVMLIIPEALYHPVVTNCELYPYMPKKQTVPLHVTFCAYNFARKGFPLLVEAFNRLTDEFHLHIVGDWQNSLHLLTNKNYTFYGVISPEELTSVYERTHIFVNLAASDQYALDGFPTTAAVDAMSTGCVLVSTNPRNDRLALESGVDYIEVHATPSSVVDALIWIKDNYGQAMQIGINGAKKINDRFDCKKVVKSKLSHILGE
jgi:glycosyltransferase involved in cell wall biosynthesis